MGELIKINAKKPLSTKENSTSNKQKTGFQSQSTHVDQILFLQRTIGNQAVQRLIKSGALQAKLRIGQPGDKYEQEADRVADAVMRMPEPEMQRQEEEEEVLQTKPLVDQITPVVQRQVEEEEEEEMLQAKSREDATSEVTHDLESQINAIKGGGRPLGESERGFFEPRFGSDFSQVRVHTAYTIGKDVVFQEGQYAPRTSEGRRLLAHELTHVIQQEKVQRNPSFRQMGDKYEQEAIQVERAVIKQGPQAKLIEANQRRVHRQIDEGEEKSIQAKMDGDRMTDAMMKMPQPGIHPHVFGVNVSNLSFETIQSIPVDAAVLITELDRYGRREVLQGLVDAKISAIDRFHDVLKQQSDQLTDFWGLIGGGIATTGLGAGASTSGAAAAAGGSTAAGIIAGVAALVIAAGTFIAGQWTKAGVDNFLRESKRRCREEAETHGLAYEPTVSSLANSFGLRIVRGQESAVTADTEQYVQIRQIFRTRILQAPNNNTTYDLKWNQLCNRWNDYLRRSTFWGRYPDEARSLLMRSRRIRR